MENNSAYTQAVDQVIDKAQPFAQPILNYLRALVHTVCPETNETIKWGMPFFEYRGKNLAAIASFKQHCSLGFWYHFLLSDPDGVLKRSEEGGMGSLGKIRSMEDLPTEKQLTALILESMSLIEKGVKVPQGGKAKVKEELVIPEILAKALKKDKVAKAAFDGFSYSHQKEYVNWIAEAKGEDTRKRRVEKTLENLQEGKSKEWKYQRK